MNRASVDCETTSSSLYTYNLSPRKRGNRKNVLKIRENIFFYLMETINLQIQEAQ